MKKINFLKRERFIEGDYLLRRMAENKSYISSELMDSLESTCDLTFVFSNYEKGFKAIITDNNTDELIGVDKLNKNAMEYYVRTLKELTRNRINNLVAV